MISEKMPTWEQNRASGHCGAERLKNVDAFASIYHTNVAGNLSLESLHLWTALVRPRLQMLNHFPQNIFSRRAAPLAEHLAVTTVPQILRRNGMN